MSSNPRDGRETSVTVSLAELARIEDERVRDEVARRAHAREMEAREAAEAARHRRAIDAANAAAEAERRAAGEREELERIARLEARKQAAIDVARIEAEAKARLEADNARRGYELEVLRAKTRGGGQRRETALAVVLGLVLCGALIGGCAASRQMTQLEQECARLRDDQSAARQARERAMAMELAALDRRHAALRARPLVAGAEDTAAAAEVARNALNTAGGDDERMRAFADALEAMQARLERLAFIAELDRRAADLAAWARKERRSDLGAPVGAARARLGADDASLAAYAHAIDKLRDALAHDASALAEHHETTKQASPTSSACSNPAHKFDPLCTSLDPG